MIRQGIDPYREASFSFRNRIARALWGTVYIFVFRLTPRPAHGLRAALLRLFGATIGRNCHVYPRARIWAPWNLVMEDDSGLADDVNCYSMAQITIGAKAVVSQGAHLCAGTHDYEDPGFQLYALPIMIGAQAWICTEAFVGPGVEVGQGAVIGARAVVTKSMPEWTVCAGNPCRPFKPRRIRAS
jgi:putative colanic acid biosynthesis acetyltransferase WcaF